MVNNIQQQINCLSDRIDNLENLGVGFYVPLIISAFALGITIYHLIIKRRYENFDRIENNIDNARTYLFQTVVEMTKDKTIDGENKLKIIAVASEHLYNKFDDACRYYLKNKINKKEFNSKYRQAIIDIINSDKKSFETEITKHTNMLEYYKKENLSNKKNNKS